MPSGASTRSRMTSSNGAPPARAASTPSTWEPAEYSHRSPGWASRGSSPSRAIQVSGSGVVTGLGGPNEASSSSSTADTIGHGSGPMNIAPCMPKPQVKVSRSRTVTGRSALTVSVSGPSGRRSTRRPASSGSSVSTGPARSSTPSSTRLRITAAVIGLVVEEMRNKVSGRIGGPPAAIAPAAVI